MKNKKNIFLNIISVAVCAMCLSGASFAATNNGCGDEDNEFINPALALCSTHVYNIGQTTNPTSSSDKQAMRDVVALKTTVMMQQMKKQYDYLDTTISRFKTQLEKAVLTTGLEAAGATSDSDSSYGGMNTGNNKNSAIVLEGAQDCNFILGATEDAYSCIQKNLQIVLSALNTNQGEAKRQLQQDIETADKWLAQGTTEKGKASSLEGCVKVAGYSSTTKDIKNCAYNLNIALVNADKEEKQQAANQQKRN